MATRSDPSRNKSLVSGAKVYPSAVALAPAPPHAARSLVQVAVAVVLPRRRKKNTERTQKGGRRICLVLQNPSNDTLGVFRRRVPEPHRINHSFASHTQRFANKTKLSPPRSARSRGSSRVARNSSGSNKTDLCVRYSSYSRGHCWGSIRAGSFSCACCPMSFTKTDSRLPAACPRLHSGISSRPPLPSPTARRSAPHAFATPPPPPRSPATEQTKTHKKNNNKNKTRKIKTQQ